MIRLSIIIPFYNVEQYIAQCLDSVYQQDIPETEYEVICVNDASPDGSREIVKQYQKMHKNLILVEHEKNKKLGAARNTGRKIAKGTYIWNVDSDDMIAPNCLKNILDICEREDLDVLDFGYTHNAADFSKDTNELQCHDVLSGEAHIMQYYHQRIGDICPIWRRLYKRDFLDRNNIYSPEINYGEDMPFALDVFALANRILRSDGIFYMNRQNTASLTGNKQMRLLATKMYEDKVECPYYIYQSIIRCEPYLTVDVREIYHALLKYSVSELWMDYDKMNSEEQKKFWKICRGSFWKNRFILHYMGNRLKLKYIRKSLLSI